MARYTFFSQAAKDATNVAASAEELINCYAEQSPGDARTRLSVRSVLGEVEFADTGTALVRAVGASNDKVYAISATRFYEVSQAGAATDLAGVGDSEASSISNNGTYVPLTSDGTYYVWDGSTMATPGGGAFTSAGSVTFMDYDTIITELDGRRFEWTNTADPLTRNALDFASAEARQGNIIRGLVDRTQLYLFCEKCVEVWYNTGASGADRPSRYQRLTVIDKGRGLKGYHLVARDAFGIFFIGNDDVAYITAGTDLVEASTPAVNSDLTNGTPTSCGYYEDQGHKFCVIRFADRPAWVLDLTTKLWHRRQSGVIEAPWGIQRIIGQWDAWYGFDDFGAVLRLARTNTDRGNTLKRIMRGKPIDAGGDDFSLSEFEAMCSVGLSNIGRDAEVMFRASWDGGLTWGDVVTASIGNLGDYSTQASFYGLGRGRVFVPEVSCTEPHDVVFYSDARIRIT